MSSMPLQNLFDGSNLDPRLRWWNPPAQWSRTPAGSLLVRPDARTDFWQRTHYGYETDNGHCLFAEVAGDFIFSTAVTLRPAHRYDQAGLILRLSRDCWLKAPGRVRNRRRRRAGGGGHQPRLLRLVQPGPGGQ